MLQHLSGWQQSAYARVETGTRSPTFDQLVAIYTALSLAGVQLTLQDRQHFVLLAKKKIESRKTRHERKNDDAWEQLRYELARIDKSPLEANGRGDAHLPRITRPRFAETRHLVGREQWLASLAPHLQGALPKKLLVLQGPTGIGKSSELHRLAKQFLQAPARYTTVFCELPPVERRTIGPESALDMLLGEILSEIGQSDAMLLQASLETRIAYALSCLERASRPVFLFLDNAENVLDEQGLTWCWEHFFRQFLQWQHQATLVLATKEWNGWFEEEQTFVEKVTIPPLEPRAGVPLLQRFGLQDIPLDLLQQIHEAVSGVPQALEWIALLVRNPMEFDSWEVFDLDDGETDIVGKPSLDRMLQRIRRLLADPSILGGPAAAKLKPLLDRVLEKRLSSEAQQILYQLSVATIPLGKYAVRVLCPRPSLLHELQNASLLVAHERHVQVLPLVAAALRTRLSAEKKRDLEERLAAVLFDWLTNSQTLHDRDMGRIVTELTEIYLNHHRFLDAAQFITRYGWLSFRLGHARRLAQLALKHVDDIRQGKERPQDGAELLYYFLAPILGYKINSKGKETAYRTMYDAALTETLRLHPPILVFITHNLMLQAMNEHRFEEARHLLDTSCAFLAPFTSDVDLQASLLEKRAWLFGRWCDYQDEQGKHETEQAMREHAIALYQQCSLLLTGSDMSSPLIQHFLNKRQAKVLNYLGYHLKRLGRPEESLQALLESLRLQRQGYAELDSLPPLYGDIAQTLLALGHFQEAKNFDALAYTEAERLAYVGYAFSQEELHIHRANRGNLYLHLGRVDEAEVLLQEALLHIHPRRSMYKVMATRAHEEIQQWRKQQGGSPSRYQLDWRYVEKYRQLASYDTYWWWGAAGPFTQEERQEWDKWCISPLDEKSKEQLGQVIRRSRTREIEMALSEQREPRFHYPALDIDQVRAHLKGFHELDAQIRLDEQLHPLVRQWYEEAIEEEIIVLHLIEATYEGNSERVRELNRQLIAEPTEEEMAYTISRVRRLIIQGKLHAERLSEGADSAALETAKAIREATNWVILLTEQLGIQLDLSASLQEKQELLAEPPLSPVTATASTLIPHQAAIRFIEAVLQQAGYAGWRVIADPLSRDPHLEQALRHVYLPTRDISVDQLKDYVRHELLDGHVARCVAGEQSLIGLLGIHLSHSLEMEEGLATYKEIQNAAREGRAHDESGIWFGTLAVGLAAGVGTAPQTFSRLFTFFDALIYLYRLVKRPDQSVQVARERAQAIALGRCFRTYRGVPDLTIPGVCYTKDVLYQRGLHKIMRALEEDSTVVDRLAVGVVALEHLPDLKNLGMVAAPQALTTMMQDSHIDEYILSCVHSNAPHCQEERN